MKNIFVCLFLVSVSCTSVSHPPTATLAVINAHIWTGDTAHPWASSMAVKDDSLVFVGDSSEYKNYLSDSTDIIDAHGQMIVPGFIDSHVHFLDGGYSLLAVQLRDISTKKDFIHTIAEYAKTIPPGTWITGGVWNHQNWGGELPEASWIDSVTPNNPVWLMRMDGHMGIANTLAMKGAGIKPSTRPTTGQDATVAGLQRILTGDQYMTVWKAIKPEAGAAAQIAVALAKGDSVPSGLVNQQVNNGKKNVPSVILVPTAVIKTNVNKVVQGGDVKKSDLCKGSFASACQSAGV